MLGLAPISSERRPELVTLWIEDALLGIRGLLDDWLVLAVLSEMDFAKGEDCGIRRSGVTVCSKLPWARSSSVLSRKRSFDPLMPSPL